MLQRPLSRRLPHGARQASPAGAGAATQDGAADPAPARLFIHATQDSADDGGALSLVLRRLRPWAMAGGRDMSPAFRGLGITDLAGCRYFTADELPPILELTLPAGIYHITVGHGSQQRRYTLALGQGVAFHLQLRAD